MPLRLDKQEMRENLDESASGDKQKDEGDNYWTRGRFGHVILKRCRDLELLWFSDDI